MRIASPYIQSIDFLERIENIEICVNDFATNLVCIAVEKKIILGLIRLPEENDCSVIEWERIKDIYHDSRCHALAFSADTSLMVIPKVVNVCSADSDYILRIFRTDLQMSDTVQNLKGHTNYINDISWDYNGEYLASVSDDQSCKIWNISNYESVITFCLASPGMSVKWHPEERNKIIVAEKRGIIYLYNVHSQQAIISVETKFPLIYADWSLQNRFNLAVISAGEIVTWDLRRPSRPMDVKQAHEDSGRIIRFCPHSELIATIGKPDITLKVFNIKSTMSLIEAPLKSFNGLSWHNRQAYLLVASDRKILIWKMKTN